MGKTTWQYHIVLCIMGASLTTACADLGDDASLGELASSQNAMTAQKTSTNDTTDALTAVKLGDLKTIERIFTQFHTTYEGPISLQRGVISDYLDGDVATILRHHSVAEPIVLFVPSGQISAQLLTTDGRTIDVPVQNTALRDGGIKATIDPSQLSAQGILRLQDQTETKPLYLPVLDEQWTCASVSDHCAEDDYACLLKTHEPCFAKSLDVRALRQAGASPQAQLSTYINTHGGLEGIVITPSPKSNVWQVEFKRPAYWSQASVKTLRLHALSPDGQSTPLSIAKISEGNQLIQLEASSPRQPPEGSILLIDARPQTKGLVGLGVGTQLFKGIQKTWSIEGCIEFLDDVNAATTMRPVVNARVKWSGKAFGLYAQWTSTRTDASGCFSMTKQKNGLKRYLKLELAFDDGLLHVKKSFSFSNYFKLWESANKLSHGAHDVGTLTFAPSQPDELGEAYRQRQAISWYMAHRVHDALIGSDNWLGFHQKYQIKHPSSILDGTAWNIGEPTIYLKEDGWSSFILLHEMGHIWHYMHKSGWGWNVVYDAVHGLSTHNCQESKNVAFLEGWAEFFQRHIRNEIPEWYHYTSWNRPRSFEWLNNHPACATEGVAGLTSPSRLIRNDDGVMHALDLLIVDNFYNRDFLTTADWVAWDFTSLDPGCNYFVFNDLDFIDVMKTFRASPAHGYASHFSNSTGIGIEEFHERFRKINMMSVQFAADRKQYWDTSTVDNPNQICHDVCEPDVSWWDGSNNDAFFDGANCYVDPVPSGKTGFVSSNQYFVEHHPTCPLGLYDGANCYVGTPAAGTTPFIYDGNLYTTALPGNICPLGTYDGANCYVGTPAAGTTPFIYDGNLYTSPLMGCSIGTWTASGCFMGTAPAGRTPFVYAGNFYYSPS